jgi:hypothetical protein
MFFQEEKQHPCWQIREPGQSEEILQDGCVEGQFSPSTHEGRAANHQRPQKAKNLQENQNTEKKEGMFFFMRQIPRIRWFGWMV